MQMCSTIVDAITFTSAGIFVNPSRASPYRVKPQPPALDAQRSATYALTVNAVQTYQYAVFTSVVVVTRADLTDRNTSSMFRQINGVLCQQEWERFCAFFCMVFGERELRAQIYEDAVTFSTRARPKEGKVIILSTPPSRDLTDNTDQPRTVSGISRLFSGKGSGPSSPVKVSSSAVTVRGALNFDDDGK
jgi:hypothetical protein